MNIIDASEVLIEQVLEQSHDAFFTYRSTTPSQRKQLLSTIAKLIEEARVELVAVAAKETHLPETRLNNELNRTIFQLESYGAACLKGYWMEASIDHEESAQPAKPTIRKLLIPLGPVVVFGSSNFPFAYSTAGGDTASALAAGCTVVIKAHPAHPETSSRMASCIAEAVALCGLPAGVFQHVFGASHQVGKWLVQHPHTAAVGFTGSFTGGKQLVDWAAARHQPIPVFAEMGSLNPVFILPEKLNREYAQIANQLVGSYTLGVGQFCTKPGVIIGIESPAWTFLLNELSALTSQVKSAPLLHEGIAASYKKNCDEVLLQPGVRVLAQGNSSTNPEDGNAMMIHVSADDWLSNKYLQAENFGPFTIAVQCKNAEQLIAIAKQIEGQLTGTIYGTEEELADYALLISWIETRCGRLIFNGVPTGVEVCKSMQHGGPFPATSDARFGAVGEDAIRRFLRPLAYQNWPDSLLPAALQEKNPLTIPRFVNGKIHY